MYFISCHFFSEQHALGTDGCGVLTLKSGDVYQGQFVESDMTGVGVMISADGSKYRGEFRSGKFNGYGCVLLQQPKVLGLITKPYFTN